MLASFSSLPPLRSDRFDYGLMLVLLALVSIGLVIVGSSSIEFASERYGDPSFIVKKQFIFLLMGISISIVVFFIPLSVVQRYSLSLLLVGVALLIAALIPGIGKVVNGSRRWLSLGPFTMQASEAAKLCFIVFFAGYLDRRNEYVRSKWSAFFVMTSVVVGIVLLLLLEPDFGNSVILCLTLGTMMFVAGVPLLRFLLLAITGVIAMSLLAVLSPYRWERLVAFMDPWSIRFGDGYQLVQSLIGFGRGEFFGVGLGNGMQKALFLPESHTDFIFSVYVEEFGFFGAMVLIALVLGFVYKIASIAIEAINKKHFFGAYLCIGIGLMLALQAFINMGVASGLLPTKGLTFPFVSYGGSSLLITCMLLALVFRVKWEVSHEQ